LRVVEAGGSGSLAISSALDFQKIVLFLIVGPELVRNRDPIPIPIIGFALGRDGLKHFQCVGQIR
jgi:hypothetical protein